MDRKGKIYVEHQLTYWLALVAVGLSLVNGFNGFFVNRSNINHIQDSRKAIAMTNCEAQNDRHDIAILKGVPILIADNLAPKQNCKKLIKQRYG